MSEALLQNGRIAELLKQGEPERKALQPYSGGRLGKRYHNAGVVTRLNQDFKSLDISPDDMVTRYLDRVRGRSRYLAVNDGYYRHFITLCRRNIVGPKGVRFASVVKGSNGKIDKNASQTIESAWRDFSKRGNCVFRDRLSFRQLERVIVNTVARDGEIFLRKWFGRGKYGYQVEIIDPARVPTQYNAETGDGGKIINGIEYDHDGIPAFYYFEKKSGPKGSGQYDKVRAEFVIHVFDTLWSEQKRGFPWMEAGLSRLHNVDKYEFAELAQARIAAEKGGFFQKNAGADGEYEGDTGDDDSGEVEYMDSEAGSFATLPEGWEFNQWDPTHPTTAFESFHDKLLRGIANAGGVDFVSLANDLSNVNYSSARIGKLDSQDHWQELQSLFIEIVHDEIYADWLRMALTKQILRLDPGKYVDYLAVIWRPRTWQWIDPAKEAIGAEKRLKMRTTTLTELAAERGLDFADVLDQLAKEIEMAEEKGVDISDYLKKPETIPDGAVARALEVLSKTKGNGHATTTE